MNKAAWTARLLGLAIIGLVAMFAAGDFPNPLVLPREEAAMVWALLVALTGMLVLWHRELIGGSMVLIGMTAFYLINFLSSGSMSAGYLFPLFFLPGNTGAGGVVPPTADVARVRSAACDRWIGGRRTLQLTARRRRHCCLGIVVGAKVSKLDFS